jgi:hypothetical protein
MFDYQEPTEYYENPISSFSASSDRFATVEEKIKSETIKQDPSLRPESSAY